MSSYDADYLRAETLYQAETKAGALTADQISRRRLQRRLFAEQNNASEGRNSGAAQALSLIGAPELPMDDATYTTNKAAFESALATLVADGASPTQAHVTAANSAYATMKPDLRVRDFVAADRTAFEAKLAALVALGASPTQQAVSDTNTTYSTFAGGLL
jgi:hypothetical protein